MFLCFVDFFLGHVNSNITIIWKEKFLIFIVFFLMLFLVLKEELRILE